MEKSVSPTITKGEQTISGEPYDVPMVESNSQERNGSSEEEKGHTHEPEKVVEWGGPNNRYGKVLQRTLILTLLLFAIVEHYSRKRGL